MDSATGMATVKRFDTLDKGLEAMGVTCIIELYKGWTQYD